MVTATQIELHQAHKARVARFSAAAMSVRDIEPPIQDRVEMAKVAASSPVADAIAQVESPKILSVWGQKFSTYEIALALNLPEDKVANSLAKMRDDLAAIWQHPSINTIKKTVCEYFGVYQRELIAYRRDIDVARPRQIAIYLSKKLTPFSLPKIGKLFGDRDHTTILSSVRRIEFLMKSDPKLALEVGHLRSQLEPQ